MRKTFLTLTILCFAITMVFGQQQIEVLLSDDKPSTEKRIGELFTFFFSKGEADAQGYTPVYIELENRSDEYLILLFDRAWSKDDLRNSHIYFAKGLPGDYVHKIENINNLTNDFRIPTIDGQYRCRFPTITIKEGESFECLVPIHVAKEKKMFFSRKKKKIIDRIHDVTIIISVENTDPDYLPLKQRCDSLVDTFNDSLTAHAFCTNKLHKPEFEKQIYPFTDEQDYLKVKINETKTKFEPGSSKYQKYEELLAELEDMDTAIEEYKASRYDCGDKSKHKTIHNCKYCKLSFEEIYNLLDRYYKNLFNRKVEKEQIMSDVNALYKCCADASCPKHASQWRKGGRVKDKIIERYNQIKAYGQ